MPTTVIGIPIPHSWPDFGLLRTYLETPRSLCIIQCLSEYLPPGVVETTLNQIENRACQGAWSASALFRPSVSGPASMNEANDKIRLFSKEDYSRICQIRKSAWTDYPSSPDELRFQDEHRANGSKFRRWVAEREGRVVAVAEYRQPFRMYHPRKFEIAIEVDPAFQREGIGAALYEVLEAELKSHDPLEIQAVVRDDMAGSVRFLESRNFRQTTSVWESSLDVKGFDRSAYADLERKVQALGIKITTAKALELDPDRDRKLFELESELLRDIPGERTQLDFHFFVESMLKNPNSLPDAYFVATRGGEYVGASSLIYKKGSGSLFIRSTGVRKAYRRKGLAAALKLRTVSYALEGGYESIRTHNASDNGDILKLNERLGFVRQFHWVSYVKSF